MRSLILAIALLVGTVAGADADAQVRVRTGNVDVNVGRQVDVRVSRGFGRAGNSADNLRRQIVQQRERVRNARTPLQFRIELNRLRVLQARLVALRTARPVATRR